MEERDLELLVPALEECHEVAVAQARLPLQLSSRVFALRNIVFWSRSDTDHNHKNFKMQGNLFLNSFMYEFAYDHFKISKYMMKI